MSDITFRKAVRADLPEIIRLLADDSLGRSREVVSDPLDARYVAAFEAIDKNPDQLLAVAVGPDGVAGSIQVSFLPGLSRTGMWRGQIEGVRIADVYRGAGLGRRFIEWAVEQCRARGCGLVQLTSDKSRTDALRFYGSLGFVASHEGLKLSL